MEGAVEEAVVEGAMQEPVVEGAVEEAVVATRKARTPAVTARLLGCEPIVPARKPAGRSPTQDVETKLPPLALAPIALPAEEALPHYLLSSGPPR